MFLDISITYPYLSINADGPAPVRLMVRLFSDPDQSEPGKGDQSIEQQQGIAQVKSKHFDQEHIQKPGQQGGKQDHQGNQPVADSVPGEKSEGEEAQQGTVGIAGDGEYRVDDAVVVQGTKDHDDGDKQEGKGNIDPHPDLFLFCIRLVIEAEKVGIEGCSEGGEGGIGRGESGRGNAQHKDNPCRGTQLMQGQVGKQIVGIQDIPCQVEGQLHSCHLYIGIKQYSQGEKNQVGDHQDQAVEENILLGLLQAFAGQAFLHLVLVEPIHGNSHHNTCDKLLVKVLLEFPVPVKNGGIFAVDDGSGHLPEGEVQITGNNVNANPHGQQHHKGLEGVGPDDGLNACLVGVGPDEQKGEDHRKHEGDMVMLKYGQVQNPCHHKEPERGPDGLGNQKEQGTGPV